MDTEMNPLAFAFQSALYLGGLYIITAKLASLTAWAFRKITGRKSRAEKAELARLALEEKVASLEVRLNETNRQAWLLKDSLRNESENLGQVLGKIEVRLAGHERAIGSFQSGLFTVRDIASKGLDKTLALAVDHSARLDLLKAQVKDLTTPNEDEKFYEDARLSNAVNRIATHAAKKTAETHLTNHVAGIVQDELDRREPEFGRELLATVEETFSVRRKPTRKVKSDDFKGILDGLTEFKPETLSLVVCEDGTPE